MSTPSPFRRGKLVRIASLYSALIAVGLLSALPPLSPMNVGEWTSLVLLLIVVLGSGTLAFAPSRWWRVVLATARVLWVLGVAMFIRHVADAGEIAWAEAGPALIVSHVLVVSLWMAVSTSATLVLWREHVSRVRAR